MTKLEKITKGILYGIAAPAVIWASLASENCYRRLGEQIQRRDVVAAQSTYEDARIYRKINNAGVGAIIVGIGALAYNSYRREKPAKDKGIKKTPQFRVET